MSDNIQAPNRGLKCAKCRNHVVAAGGQYTQSATDPSLWCLDPEGLPEWILKLVDESGWTKGRISCPNERCQSRIGSFDFVGASADTIHVVRSKVDEFGVRDHALAATIERRSGQGSVQEAVESTSSPQSEMVAVAPNVPYPRFGESSDDAFDFRDHVGWSTTSSSNDSDNIQDDEGDGEDENDDEPRANVVEVDMVFSHGDYRLLSRRARRRRLTTKKYRKRLGKKRRMTFEEKRAKDQKFIQDILDAEPELDRIDPVLICPVCLDLLHDPHAAIPCKHVFCETCLRRLGSKNAMDTLCPMCRQRIVFCEEQKDLGDNIKYQFSELYYKRKSSEQCSPDVYNLPLPWRPGWRNLMSGRPLGGNQFNGQTTTELIGRIVQQLPYYIPPVFLANIINLVFFVFLLFAVEVVPFFLSLFIKKPQGSHSHLNRNLEVSSELSVDELALRVSGSGEVHDNDLPSDETSFPIPETFSEAQDTTIYCAFYVVVLFVSFIGNFFLTQEPHHGRENRGRLGSFLDVFRNMTAARICRAIGFATVIGIFLVPAVTMPFLVKSDYTLLTPNKMRWILNFMIKIMVWVTDFFTSYYGIPIIAGLVAFLF